MKVSFLLLLGLVNLNVFAQELALKYSNKEEFSFARVKKAYQYTHTIRINQLTGDSNLISIRKYKRGKLRKKVEYDTTGEQVWSTNYYHRSDKSKNMTYDWEKSTHYEENWSNDTTYHKSQDKFYYRNRSFEQKSGNKVFNEKGKLIELNILFRSVSDTGFHLFKKAHYLDSVLIKTAYYNNDKPYGKVATDYFEYDSLGRFISMKRYLANKPDSAEIVQTVYYNQTGTVKCLDVCTNDKWTDGGPEIGYFLITRPAHYVYIYEYNDKGLVLKKTTYKNESLSEVISYVYIY